MGVPTGPNIDVVDVHSVADRSNCSEFGEDVKSEYGMAPARKCTLVETGSQTEARIETPVEEIVFEEQAKVIARSSEGDEEESDKEGDEHDRERDELGKKGSEESSKEGDEKKGRWRCYHCWTHLENKEAICRYCKDQTVAKMF